MTIRMVESNGAEGERATNEAVSSGAPLFDRVLRHAAGVRIATRNMARCMSPLHGNGTRISCDAPRPQTSRQGFPCLRHARLLHRDRLPAPVAAHEEPRVPELPAERKAAEGAGVVGDPLEQRDISIDPHRETVVVDRRQLQLPARDVTDIVGPGSARTEPRDLDELGRDHAGKRDSVRAEERLAPVHLDGTHAVLGRRAAGRSLCGQRGSRGGEDQESSETGTATSVHETSPWVNRPSMASAPPAATDGCEGRFSAHGDNTHDTPLRIAPGETAPRGEGCTPD